MTSWLLIFLVIFNVDGTTCHVRAWREILGVSVGQSVSGASSNGGSGKSRWCSSSGESDSSCSTKRQRNWAGLNLCPRVNLEPQLKHRPCSCRAAISDGVSYLITNGVDRGVGVVCICAGGHGNTGRCEDE